MAYRFAFFALFIFSTLFCSNETSSQKSQSSKSAESNEGDDISAGDGIKTIGEYGKWDLNGYVSDPIEEKKVYFITTYSKMTYSNFYGDMELIVHCSGFVWIQSAVKKRAEERLLLNYRGSSESHLAYALRVKWGSGMEKRIDKIWAECERNSGCQSLVLYPYKESSLKERLIKSNENQFAEVAPSLKEPMTTYDELMLEVKVIQSGSAYLKHFTFDLDGFAEANDALLAKGCKPIPPLIAVKDLALHTLGAAAEKNY